MGPRSAVGGRADVGVADSKTTVMLSCLGVAIGGSRADRDRLADEHGRQAQQSAAHRAAVHQSPQLARKVAANRSRDRRIPLLKGSTAASWRSSGRTAQPTCARCRRATCTSTKLTTFRSTWTAGDRQSSPRPADHLRAPKAPEVEHAADEGFSRIESAFGPPTAAGITCRAPLRRIPGTRVQRGHRARPEVGQGCRRRAHPDQRALRLPGERMRDPRAPEARHARRRRLGRREPGRAGRARAGSSTSTAYTARSAGFPGAPSRPVARAQRRQRARRRSACCGRSSRLAGTFEEQGDKADRHDLRRRAADLELRVVACGCV